MIATHWAFLSGPLSQQYVSGTWTSEAELHGFNPQQCAAVFSTVCITVYGLPLLVSWMADSLWYIIYVVRPVHAFTDHTAQMCAIEQNLRACYNEFVEISMYTQNKLKLAPTIQPSSKALKLQVTWSILECSLNLIHATYCDSHIQKK